MVFCQSHQILPIFRKRVVGFFRTVASNTRVAAHGGKNRKKTAFGNPETLKHAAHGGIGFIQHGDHNVFDGDIFVLHTFGLLFSFHQNGVHVARDIDFPGLTPWAGHTGQLFDLLFHILKDGAGVNSHFFQKLRNQTICLTEQSGGQVFLLDLHIVIGNCGTLCFLDGFQRFLRKILYVHGVHLPVTHGLYDYCTFQIVPILFFHFGFYFICGVRTGKISFHF